MEQEKSAELQKEELQQEAKKMKSNKIFDAVMFGLLIGIAIYSTVKNGFGLLTFLPLLYLPIAGKNQRKSMAIEKALKEKEFK